MKLFEQHPLPWEIEYNAAYCGNGSDIHIIRDANNQVVASSYNSGFDALWQLYSVLTHNQKQRLGDNFIKKAELLAGKYHAGQKRKWTSEPYINHPARVAAKVAKYQADGDLLSNMICAAWLHDTIEDCPDMTPPILEAEFGEEITKLVIELTNVTSKSDKKLSRAERKALDRKRLSCISRPAKVIKLADRIDNLSDMRDAPIDFLRIYTEESKLLLETLKGTYEPFENELRKVINDTSVLLPWSVPRD